MKKKVFTDTDFEMFIMPFGKHKNKTIDELPASYILWLSNEKFCPEVLLEYVENNIDELQARRFEEEELEDLEGTDIY